MLLGRWRELAHASRLPLLSNVCDNDITYDPRKGMSDRTVSHLVKLVLSQAIRDGMTALRVGATNSASPVYLKYGWASETGESEWWDMTPPPSAIYNHFIRSIVSLTEFDDGTSAAGTLRARVGHRNIDISVRITAWTEVELRWSM